VIKNKAYENTEKSSAYLCICTDADECARNGIIDYFLIIKTVTKNINNNVITTR
jgi:hypothetical protein